LTYDRRRLIAFGIGGILLASALILAVQLMPLSQYRTGVLLLEIKDARPDRKPTSLSITHRQCDGSQRGRRHDTWITFSLNPNRTYDLVQLENETAIIGANKMPVGNYTQIRMHILSAIATINGSIETLTVPSDYIKIPLRFGIQDSNTTIILLDITYNSVQVSASHNLRPVILATLQEQP
jgi:hypothetical protein